MTDPTLMLDGINSLARGIAAQFPNLAKVAGYVNGTYAWSQAEWDLFPHADHVTISVTAAANAGDVLDVEIGDATPAQAPGWIAMRHAAGLYRPTVYCNRSTVPAVRSATGHLILGQDYDIWVAEYTTRPTPPACPGLPPASFAAWQYESTASWDANRVLDPGWPHRSPAHPAPVIAAPGSPSGTPHETANLSWQPVTGPDGKPVASYRYQWRDGAGVVGQALTSGTHVAGLPLAGPGPHSWRVQAAGGAWTDWQPLS